MSNCSACDALLSRSIAAEPHSRLDLEYAVKRSEGILERYRCLSCDARWEWLMNTPAPHGALQARLLGGPPEPGVYGP